MAKGLSIFTFAATSMVLTALGPVASADHQHHEPRPVGVFIAMPQHPNLGHAVRDSFADHAPGHIFLVRGRHQADYVVRVSLEDFQHSFRIVDVDRKDKKYKKRLRWASNPCDRLFRAHFDRVKERATAHFTYRVAVRSGGRTLYRDRGGDRVSDSFKYARNLRAETGCGFRQVSTFPSSGVAKLFNNDRPGVRHAIVERLRYHMARDIGEDLARLARQATSHGAGPLAGVFLGSGITPYFDKNVAIEGHRQPPRLAPGHREVGPAGRQHERARDGRQRSDERSMDHRNGRPEEQNALEEDDGRPEALAKARIRSQKPHSGQVTHRAQIRPDQP